MKVSIALCTYNGEEFLSEQLDSYLRQTRLPDELIVCDDRSGDKTIDILNDFKSKAPFAVKIHINAQNLGSTKNFEQAIALCAGDFVFLSDQDDVWKNDKIEVVLKEFEKIPEALLIFTDGDLIGEDGKLLNSRLWEKWKFGEPEKKKWKNNSEAFKDLFFNDNKITGATLALKKDLLNFALPIETPVGYLHDVWLGLMAAGKNGLHFIDSSLIYYRVHRFQQIGLGTGKFSSENAANSPDKNFNISWTDYENKVFSIFPRKKKLIKGSFWSKTRAFLKNRLTG